MIVCQACGTRNADNERFCGQCGAFLDWEGAVVDRGGESKEPADAPETAETETAETETGTAQPGQAAGGDGSAATAEPETGRTASPAGPGSASPPAGKVRAGAVAATATATGATAAGASAQAGGPSATAPTEVKPGGLSEVKPGAPQRPRSVAAPVPVKREAPRPGDLICGECGTGNDPSRRFCRSCGARLTNAVVAHVPWWRRLWLWLTRRNKYEAGQRRQRRVRPHLGRVVRLLALVLVVALAIGYGPRLVRLVVNEVRDRTGDHVPITPTGFGASSARRGADAALIGDGATNRFWSPTGDGKNGWVEAYFGRSVRVLDIVVTPGISTKQEQFLTTGRPHTLEVVGTGKSGAEQKLTLTLRDAPGPQTFTVEVDNVTQMRLIVRSVYGPAAKAGVAVAEVEFFGRL